QVITDVRQHGAIVLDIQRCPGRPPGGDPLAELCEPPPTLAPHGPGPPTHARSLGRPQWKSLRGREHDGGLCVLRHGWDIPATLIDPRRLTLRKRQTQGMR